MSRITYSALSLLFFLILLSVSSFFSINVLHSSLRHVGWMMYACVFLLSLSLKLPFLTQKKFLLGIFLSFCFLFFCYSSNTSLFPFLPGSSLQFILRTDGHNHLGDLAGLMFSSLFCTLNASPFTFLLLFFSFGIMAISFSKSAFLSVLVVVGILAFHNRGKYFVGLLSILLASCVVVSIYTAELSSFPAVASAQKIMWQTLGLHPKQLLSVRDIYYSQVIRAWKSAPLEQLFFGYGSGNYKYPSSKTGITSSLSPPETHNIFMSIFVENGALSLIWFLIFCIFIIFFGLKQNNSSVYLFIYLLANFQTDYTYVIPFFMVLLFFFAAQSINGNPREDLKKNRFFILTALGIILLTLFSMSHYLILQKNKSLLDARLKAAYLHQDTKTMQTTIDALELLTPYEESELSIWSQMQEQVGSVREAIRLLDKLALYSPRWYLLYLPRQLDLQKKEGVDIKKYLENRKKDFVMFPYSNEEKNRLNEICIDYAKMKCIN